MSNYQSTAETAKLIRATLKESFPGTKFAVRSHNYSGGSSIYVRYTDGPCAKMVEAVISLFNGSYTDGMLDYKGAQYVLLDGVRTRFGADFIFVNRDYTDSMIERAIAGLKARYPANFAAVADKVSVEAFKTGELYRVMFFNNGSYNCHDVQTQLHGLLGKMSDRAAPEKSATLARIEFAGDDGYGAGTVGDLTKPEADRHTNSGYPQPDRKEMAEAQANEENRVANFMKSILTGEGGAKIIAFPSKGVH